MNNDFHFWNPNLDLPTHKILIGLQQYSHRHTNTYNQVFLTLLHKVIFYHYTAQKICIIFQRKVNILSVGGSTYSFLHWLFTLVIHHYSRWKHCFLKISFLKETFVNFVAFFQSATPSHPWDFMIRGQQNNFLQRFKEKFLEIKLSIKTLEIEWRNNSLTQDAVILVWKYLPLNLLFSLLSGLDTFVIAI